MTRSVMVKGLEALLIESFTGAHPVGVEDVVIETSAIVSLASIGAAKRSTTSVA